jgi:hypothetical protein
MDLGIISFSCKILGNVFTYKVKITYLFLYTGHTQKNGAVSKVNKKCISQLTRAQHTPSAAETLQISHALPAVRFSCFSSMTFVIG